MSSEYAQKVVSSIKNDNPKSVVVKAGKIGSTDVEAIVKVLKNNTSVEIFDIGDNYIKNEGVEMIADVLMVNSTIKIIKLGHVGCMSKGTFAISRALSFNKTVQELDLQRNSIDLCGGPRNSYSFAHMIRVNTTLQRLNLKDNLISEEGMYALTEALKINSSIYELNLDHCIFFGFKGIKMIADMLMVNTSIKKIFLHWNFIDCPCAKAIADMLRVNKTLLHRWPRRIKKEKNHSCKNSSRHF